ncbi:hypothetical protein C0992_003423, partial [Termitomyces sp. T32_za158]
ENKTVAGGNVPDSQIKAQITILNKAYSLSGITFVLKRTTRTVNQTWYNLVGPETSEQTEMKNALHSGSAADLNVYTVGYEIAHPSVNGCDGKGDYVGDTPAEGEPAFGCPEGRDTCPGGGKDPIRKLVLGLLHASPDYLSDQTTTWIIPMILA